MNDQDVKYLILAGLPIEYGPTRQIIRSKKDIGMEEMRSLLLSAEYEIDLKHKVLLLSLTTMITCNGMPNGYHNNMMPRGNAYSTGMQCTGLVDFVVPYNWNVMPLLYTHNAYSMTSDVTCFNAYNAPLSSNISHPRYESPLSTMSTATRFPVYGQLYSPPVFVSHNDRLGAEIHNGSQQTHNGTHNSRALLRISLMSFHQIDMMCFFTQRYSATSQNEIPLPNNCGSFSQGTMPHHQSRGTFYGSFSSNDGNNTKPKFSTTQEYGGPIICEICEKPEHGAYKCHQINPHQQGKVSSSAVECQICKTSGHSTDMCRYIINNQKRNTPMVACTDNASVQNGTNLSKTVEDHPHTIVEKGSIIAELLDNTVLTTFLTSKPVPVSIATPTSSRSKDIPLPIEENRQLSCISSARHVLNCRQASQPVEQWQSIFVFSPS